MQDTNLNIAPYFDDFNRRKNFYKVLFKPGFPVQARELTTLQSILQNQVERFGQHMFKEGSMVIPGHIGYDSRLECVTVQNLINGVSVESYRTSLHEKTIRGTSTNVRARIITSISASTSVKKRLTFYIKYLSSGITDAVTGKQFKTFSNNEILVDDDTEEQIAITSTSNASAFSGSNAKINDGVYFARGFFLEVESQNIILDQYGNTPSYKVGLRIYEEIITSEDDQSLLDNSYGYSNYASPGADRLKVSCILEKVGVDEIQGKDFIELLRVREGKIEYKVDRSVYAELERTLARRTFDESGNYSIEDYKLKVNETLDNLFNGGVYDINSENSKGTVVLNRAITTQDGNAINGNDFFTITVGPGKSYVKGYELEQQSSTYVEVQKPRTFKSKSNVSQFLDFGKYFELDTAGMVGGLSVGSFQRIYLYDRKLNESNEKEIAKATAITLTDGSGGYPRLYLTDFSTFTELSWASGTLNVQNGDLVEGRVSGAKGFVYAINNTTKMVTLEQVSGDFIEGETIDNSRNATCVTILVIRDYTIEEVNSVTDGSDFSSSTFKANLILTSRALTGDGFTISSNTNFTGSETNFLSELKTNMRIKLGNGETRINTVTNNSTATIIQNSSITNQSYTKAFKLVARLLSNQKNQTTRFAENTIKNVSDISYSIMRAFTVTFNNNVASFNLNTDGESASGSVLAIPSSGTSGSKVGSVTANNTVTVTGMPNGAATIYVSCTRSRPTLRNKTLKIHAVFKVDKAKTSTTTSYGTRYVDEDICLGVPDVKNLICVREVKTSTALPSDVFDTITVSSTSGIKIGDILFDNSENTKCRVISISSNVLTVIYYSTFRFKANQTLNCFRSDASTTVTSVTTGSYKDRTSDYLLKKRLDDEIYDISSILRKPGTSVPSRMLVIVYDYYEHTSGDFFTVDSYTDQQAYETIESDNNNMYLTDIIDYRITAQSSGLTGSGTVSSPFVLNQVLLNPGTRSLIHKNFTKPSSNLVCDYSFYIPRLDKLVLTETGEFKVIKGSPSLTPKFPEIPKNSMLIADISMPPYIRNVTDVNLTPKKNRRYTMEDIGKLEQRLESVEYYTSLTLLELETKSLAITDSTGVNRFKNGFVVDDFSTNLVSDIYEKDYRAAIDISSGTLRPIHYTTNVDFQLNTTKSTNYQKTGDLITLPYTNTLLIDQSATSRVENVNPFAVFAWIGRLDLTPTQDTWIITNRVADNVVNVEGNFEQTLRETGVGDDGIGPINWGSWRDVSVGSWNNRSSVWYDPSFRNGAPRRVMQVTTGSRSVNQERSGSRTVVTERTDFENTGDKELSKTNIKYLRERIVKLSAHRMKPNTRLHFFMNTRNMTAYTLTNLLEVYRGGSEGNVTASVGGKTVTLTPSNSVSFKVGEKVIFVGLDEGNSILPIPPIGAVLAGPSGSTSGATQSGISGDKFYVTGVVKNLYDYGNENPYTNTDLTTRSTYATTTPYLNIEFDELVDPTYINLNTFKDKKCSIVGVTSGARATLKTTRIFTDKNGAWRGIVYIPDPNISGNPQFANGSTTFRLTTSDTDSRIPGIVDTSAESKFTSEGTSSVVQAQVLAVRNANVSTQSLTQTQTITQTRRSEQQIGWYDPLAQSFLVTTSGGCFLTKVDLFFQTKDPKISVNIQVRTMFNGSPTGTILPFSDVTKKPSEVLLSENGTVATTFTFPSPVYIPENIEHCLVVFSDSNLYKMWISRMGEEDVVTKKIISEQPYAGVLFKSQNASTWTPDQYEDLKFKLYRASFKNTSSAEVYLENKELKTVKLKNDPIKMTAGSSTVTIYSRNHGMHTSRNKVTISGIQSESANSSLVTPMTTNQVTAVGGSNFTLDDVSQLDTIIGGAAISASNPGYIKIQDEIIKYSAVNASTNTITIPQNGRGQNSTSITAHAAGLIVECYNLNGIPLIDINKTHNAIGNPTLDTYTLVLPKIATASINGGQNKAYATRNIQYETITPNLMYTTFPSTSMRVRMNSVSSTSISCTNSEKQPSYEFVLNEEIPMSGIVELNSPRLIASNINQSTYLANKKSLEFAIQLDSDNPNISPVLDLERVSACLTSNRINKTSFDNETKPNGSLHESIYITREASLTNPSTSVQVMFDAVRFASNEIKVYVKLGRDDGINDFEKNNYRELKFKESYPTSKDDFDFREFIFEEKNLPQFKQFSVKIVMTAEDQSRVPLIQKFRAIALALWLKIIQKQKYKVTQILNVIYYLGPL